MAGQSAGGFSVYFNSALGPFRQRAERPLRKALRLDPEGVVEAGAVVFPGNRRGQLDELRVGETLAQFREQSVRNLNRSFRHLPSVIKNKFFER